MKSRLTIFLLLFTILADAQERLSLDDAIARALQYNYDVRISDAAAKQAAKNNTLGNAGFSPNVSINGGFTVSSYNTHNELVNGTIQDNPSARSRNTNGSVALNWTLFDGGKMFIVKKQLNELDFAARETFKAQLQTTVSRVIQVYAQLVLQQRQLIAYDTALALATTRMNISKVKYENGSSAKTDYLQARVDYHARRTDSLTQQALLVQSFDTLNVLMGADVYKSYTVDDSLPLNITLEPLEKDRLQNVNLSISAAKRNAEVSKLNVGVAKSYMLPFLGVTGAYNYSETKSATGFSFYSRGFGPTGSANLSIPIFQGGNLRRQVKVASLQAMRDELLYEKLTSSITSRYRTAWHNYTVSVASYKMQLENIGYAKENLDVQLARFRVGIANTLEVRQAENDYVAALVTYYTAAYNLKVNETIVLELENQLVK
ncbi:MAG: TolC family protein [Bacteroidetes bacterium]|nr:TolC family protein [Bacteroidota bacterium]